jgi:hypothetical protein
MLSIKEQIQQLSESKNNFILNEVHVIFKVNSNGNNNSFHIVNAIDGTLFRTINYLDVEKVTADSVIVELFLKDGTIYCLHEVREDILEILQDFNGNCMITKYKVVIEDGQAKYLTKYYTYIEDFDFYNNKRNNIVEISNEITTFVFDYDDIFSVEEQYDREHRLIQLVMMNDKIITIEEV